ncbi:spore protease YyaC [Paenactinomyces guangxiensis]|uniref:Spore protease YyaC n=2 Tax=Paenactinomyces guangxiensis TaxID=1490290 RepID=A0A7W1WQJ7_9BACL|nr:spore protease YyaC [Paenactinomyces guangxiensis]MBH8591156.1 spore protease YyaC [Paenactinomyces guangxiensis]
MPDVPTLPYRVEYTHPYAKDTFAEHLYIALHEYMPCSEMICVCIGTDRSTGDSLGPLVGTLLSREAPSHLKIYGTLDEPVHAINLSSTISHINKEHPNALVIAVDACLGQYKSVGWIQVGLGPIKPGAGVNKNLPSIGKVHITGIVNVAGFMEYFVLQNTRLSIVMNMAEVISASIMKASIQTKGPEPQTTRSLQQNYF